MNLQTPRRVISALETEAGRRKYKTAFRNRLWHWLGSLPWELNYRVSLGGQMPMILSTADQVISKAIFATGEWEPAELGILRHFLKPGMTAVDVGANIGVHSLTMAKAVGPQGTVHSFEPTGVYARLRRNIEINGFSGRVRLHHCAVGPAKGTLRLMETKPGAELFTSQSTPLDPSVGLGTFVEYPVVSLDDYCAEQGIRQIDFLKIDVEGGEPGVLAGAKRLLEERAVRCLMFEMNYPCLAANRETVEPLLASVASNGFQMLFIDRAGRFHDRLASVEDAVFDVLAIPAERSAELCTLASAPAHK